MGEVLRGEGELAVVDSAGARAAYRAAERMAGKPVVVNDPNPLVNGWLAYHARRSRVWLDSRALHNLTLKRKSLPFRDVPVDLPAGTVILNGNGERPVEDYRRAPDVWVRNPQGEDRAGGKLWYWVGDTVFLTVNNYGPQAPASFLITVRGAVGPGLRKVELLFGGRGFPTRKKVLTGEGEVSFNAPARPGRNTWVIRTGVVEGTPQPISGDARRLIVRMDIPRASAWVTGTPDKGGGG
jgi:hypothetical protein